MSLRAGVLITGTEGLSGIISDRNGPWLSERLRERGGEVAHIMIVADRRGDMRAALDFMAREGLDLIVTSGGLGPTADDITAEGVADFSGRPPGPPRAPRRRHHGRGRGRLQRSAAGPRRGARGAHLGDPRAAAAALAQPRRGRDA